MAQGNYIELKDLEVYQLSRKLSALAWEIYKPLNINDKKTMGDQFLRAVDSIGANIAEGYGRYHFLDKIKFYFNGRASMFEGCEHWAELMHEREKMTDEEFHKIRELYKKLQVKLNNFISKTHEQSKKKEA